jgi:phage recombination protein Bet
MNALQRKAQIIESLNIPSLVKINEKNYVMRVNSEWELNICLVRASNLWEAKSKGKSYIWSKALEVPADVKEIIHTVTDPYDEALKAALAEMEEYSEEEPTKKTPLDNLKESGFDISIEPEGNDIVPPERLAELKKELAEDLAKPEPDENRLASDIEKLEALERGEIETPVQKTDWKKHSSKMAAKAAEQQMVEQVTGRAVVPLDMRSKQILELTVEDIINFINPLATVQEAGMFLKLCQARGLNPFLNEAYLIKYSAIEAAQFVTGKEAFTRRAEVNQHVTGWKAGIIVRTKATKDTPAGPIEKREGSFKLPEEELLGGWAEIHRDDSIFPFIYEIALEEYIQKKRDGTITKMWREKPCTMIRKDAVVGGLREAAPSEFGGMYDAAEMGVDAIEAVYTVVD